MTRALRWFGLLASTGILAACSGDGDVSTSTTAVVDSAAPTQIIRPSDGVLTIGVLVPADILSRDQRSEFTAVVESAVRVINTNGGYNGQPVQVLFADETASLQITQRIVSDLVSEGAIDVLIGPSSSALAGPLTLDLIEQGVGVCSPAATSALLSELPDQGMMIRTSQNDAAIARAMIELTAGTGYAAAALVYPDDAYGRAFADLLHQFLDENSLNQTNPGSPEQNYDYPFVIDADGTVSNAEDLAGLAATVVVFVGNEDTARNVLPLMRAKDIIAPDALIGVDLTTIETIGNGTPVDGAAVGGESDGFLSSGSTIRGVAQDLTAGSAAMVDGLRAVDPALDPTITGEVPLLTATVDCLNILALSAVDAGSDDARTFMLLANDTTNTGTRCRSFVECIDVLDEELGIDYDGASGELSLDGNGDAVAGPLLRYDFGPEGRAVITQQLRVTSSS